MRKIILLSNTYPFGGEAFLQNEIKWIPDTQAVDIYPIFADQRATAEMCLRENVQVHNVCSHWKLKERVLAGFRSIQILFTANEMVAAMKKRRPFYNVIKAYKFAYISELRITRILNRLKHEEGANDGYIFYAYWLYEAAYIAAGLKKRVQNSLFVARCHGFDLYEIRHPNGYLPFRMYLLKNGDEIYPISDDGKEYLSRLYKNRWDQKIHVMRLGTEDHGLNPGNQNEIPVIVSCSNLVEVKRVERIICALGKSGSEVCWFHFGDGRLREKLEMLAVQLPKNIQWRFMGNVPHEQLMHFYKEQRVDVFVNVSSSEGVPVSIMEALSFGIPVVATNVGGTHEIVESGVNGILLPIEFEDQDLLDAIDCVIHGNNVFKMRAAARKIWSSRSNAGDCFGGFYDQLLGLNPFSSDEEE